MNRDRMIKRFVEYTKIDTQSEPGKDTTPSTPGQLELAKIVAEDLKKAGVSDLEFGPDGFIYATIPSNLPASFKNREKVPTVGFLAHLDTANEAPGKNVKARFIENYKGGDITFPGNPDLKLNEKVEPELKKCIGHTIITSDGTTLLGGDDKAGLAVLVELANHLKENPSDLHGKIRLAVIPDEEIGVGAEKLDLKKFGADVAYTLDGGVMGEIDVESFNGFKASVEVEGYAAFPGYGKGVYLSSIQILSKFVSMMDEKMWPQNCDGRQSIWWVQTFEGDVAKSSATVFLRSFDIEGIKDQEKMLNKIKDKLLKEFPKAKINVKVEEMYKNYKYELDKDPRVVAYAEEAMKKIGIAPYRNYVRGGNDSCHLCFNGLLSTNLFVGMKNMHSLMEWNTVETIESSLKAVVSLARVWADHASAGK